MLKPLAELRSIDKRFPANGVHAVKDVDFSIREGEIRGLIGENGAGKSTLMKILGGSLLACEGRISMENREVFGPGVQEAYGPAAAIKTGIYMVQQHPILIPSLTVEQNIYLGSEESSFGILNAKSLHEELEESIADMGLSISLSDKIWKLNFGDRVFVSLLSALRNQPRLLILDEPSALMSDEQRQKLFLFLRLFITDKRSVVYISHKLNEVKELCNAITVMSRGRIVKECESTETNEDELAQAMFSPAEIGDAAYTQPSRITKEPTKGADSPVLSLSDIYLNENGRDRLKELNLEVYAGEIHAVLGLKESGLEYLEDLIAGFLKPQQGSIRFKGKEARKTFPRFFRESSFAYVPRDRISRGSCLSANTFENLIIRIRKRLGKFGFFNKRVGHGYCADVLSYEELDFALDKELAHLSGGTIQRLMLARELSGKPDFLLVSEPSQGLDAQSRRRLHTSLSNLASAGTAVLLISSDIDEVKMLCDRVSVLYSGSLVRTLHGVDLEQETVSKLMIGMEVAQ